ncbi:MAG: recombinase A, partial [Hyphomicrobium sp.]
TGEAGSTAWNNAVRSRLYLVREEGSDQGGRVLKTMKSNYGPSDGKIPLKWDSGVYVSDHPPHEARA